MTIKFEEKEIIMDNVIYSWYISSAINDYRVALTFIGGIDENGQEDLERSCGADIEITEVDHHDKAILDEVKAILDGDIETEFFHDVIMVNSPDIRDSLITKNEDSYNSTLDNLHKMMDALTSVLFKHITAEIF